MSSSVLSLSGEGAITDPPLVLITDYFYIKTCHSDWNEAE